jgi:hypothetical protein
MPQKLDGRWFRLKTPSSNFTEQQDLFTPLFKTLHLCLHQSVLILSVLIHFLWVEYFLHHTRTGSSFSPKLCHIPSLGADTKQTHLTFSETSISYFLFSLSLNHFSLCSRVIREFVCFLRFFRAEPDFVSLVNSWVPTESWRESSSCWEW